MVGTREVSWKNAVIDLRGKERPGKRRTDKRGEGRRGRRRRRVIKKEQAQ